MTLFLRRLVAALIGSSTPADADKALDQLRHANRIAAQYRKTQTARRPSGNKVADMITGTDGPRRSER